MAFTPDANARPVARRAAWIAAECLAGLLACMAMTSAGRGLQVDPLDRIGQVSGLAEVQLRFALVGAALLALLRWCTGRYPHFGAHRVERLSCAALAGLGTGLLAAGLCVALDGTGQPLFAGAGDTARIVQWVESVRAGRRLTHFYPPLSLYAVAGLASTLEISSSHAYQLAQIYSTALFGPLAYLAWRARLSPLGALVTSLVASAPLFDPYKPATNITLVVLLPLLIGFFERATATCETSVRGRIALGAAFGLATGVLFDTYLGLSPPVSKGPTFTGLTTYHVPVPRLG